MVTVPVVNGTIPHEIIGEFVSSEIVMKPAALVPVSFPVVLHVHFSSLPAYRTFCASPQEAEMPITHFTLLWTDLKKR